MADLLAIVSKSVFEKEARRDGVVLSLGEVFATSRYRSKNKNLAKLEGGGTLFLVTVRPGDTLWLVAKLMNPSHDDDGWLARPNTEAIREISCLIPRLRFTTGNGITAAKGRLGMSLQTPRELTEGDVTLLSKPGNAFAVADSKVGWRARKVVPKEATARKPSKKTTASKTSKKTTASKTSKKTTASKNTSATSAQPPKDSASEVAPSLSDLLARWEQTRSPIIAEAIARVSRALESDEAKALRKRIKIPQSEWLELVANMAIAERGALLATLLDAPSAKVKERIAALEAWGADPRVCDALHEVVRTIPWTSSSTRPVWLLIFKRLRAYGDPRSATIARYFDPNSISSSWSGPAEWMGKRLAKLAEQIDALGPAAQIPAHEAALIRSLGKPAPASSSANDAAVLFAEVLANPGDDEIRLVLADALLIDGDPRGELIALQHKNNSGDGDRKSLQREKKLVKAHSDSLIGPMARWALKKRRRFRLGFVDECTFKDNVHGTGVAEMKTSPLLATLRKVAAPPVVLAMPNLVSMTEAHVLPAWQAPPLENFLCADRELPLKHLRLRLENEHLSYFKDNLTLKNLTTMGVVAEPETIGQLLETSVGKQLEALYIPDTYNDRGLRSFPEVVALAEPTQLKRVGIVGSGWDDDWEIELFVERRASAWAHAICRPTLKNHVPGHAAGLIELFLSTVNRGLKTIEVRSARPLRESTRTALEQVLLSHSQDASLDFETTA